MAGGAARGWVRPAFGSSGGGQHPFLCASPGPTSVPQELTASLSLLLPPVASWDFLWAFGGLPLGDRSAIVATLQEGNLRLRDVR